MDQLPTESSDSKRTQDFTTPEPKNTDSASPASRPSYTPQFSTITSLILDRVKTGSLGQQSLISHIPPSAMQHDKAAYEDAKSRLVQSMNTSVVAPTVETPPPTGHTLPLALTPQSATSEFPKCRIKRKREDSEDKVDFTQNTIAFPLPKAPVVALSTFADQTRPRGENREDQHASPKLRVQPSRQHGDEYEKLRRKGRAALPPGIVPAKPELVGFTAGRASDLARTEYFHAMKRVDLLNILSLCDQLKPQLLVDVLVSVSKKHPNLPIFNAPDWESQVPSAAGINSGRGTGPDERMRPARSLVNSKARQRQKRLKKILKRTRVIEVVTDAPDEEVLPPTWIMANEGLYAKLPPEAEDRTFLLDDNDEESFSHFMVDGYGKQIIDPVGG